MTSFAQYQSFVEAIIIAHMHWTPAYDTQRDTWLVVRASAQQLVRLTCAEGESVTYERAAKLANALNRAYGFTDAPRFEEGD